MKEYIKMYSQYHRELEFGLPFKLQRIKFRTNKGNTMLNIIELIALKFLT